MADDRISQKGTKTRTRQATHGARLLSAAQCPACGCRHCIKSAMTGFARCAGCGEKFPWDAAEPTIVLPPAAAPLELEPEADDPEPSYDPGPTGSKPGRALGLIDKGGQRRLL